MQFGSGECRPTGWIGQVAGGGGVAYHGRAIAEIECRAHRGGNADMRLEARDDQLLAPGLCNEFLQVGLRECIGQRLFDNGLDRKSVV